MRRRSDDGRDASPSADAPLVVGLVGVFGGERGQRLLHVLTRLVTQSFADLHARGGSAARYRECLRAVGNWSSKLLHEQIAAVADDDAPDVCVRLDDAYREYARAMDARDAQPPHQHGDAVPPTTDEVLRAFLSRVARSEVVASGRAFVGVTDARGALDLRLASMDALRCALHALWTERRPASADDDVRPSDSVSNCGDR